MSETQKLPSTDDLNPATPKIRLPHYPPHTSSTKPQKSKTQNSQPSSVTCLATTMDQTIHTSPSPAQTPSELKTAQPPDDPNWIRHLQKKTNVSATVVSTSQAAVAAPPAIAVTPTKASPKNLAAAVGGEPRDCRQKSKQQAQHDTRNEKRDLPGAALMVGGRVRERMRYSLTYCLLLLLLL